MVEFFHARRLRYQITLQTEGRWQLVAVVDDGRDQLGHPFGRLDLEALEKRVRAQARTALATPGAQAVRVVRERIRDDGYSQEEPFLFEEATARRPERPVSNYAGPVPLCARYEDLLERPALHVIGLILRPLLERLGMTPLELVTLQAATTSVKRAEDGINAGIAMAARLQGDKTGRPARARIAELEILAHEARRRCRAGNLASPPKLGEIGLDRFAALVDQRYPAAERRFWALRGVAEFIAEPNDYAMKLDRLLELNAPELGVAATTLLDEFVACLLDHSEVLRRLLGHQPDLRVALLRLVELAEGLAPPNSEAPEIAAQLALLIERGRLPKTQDALWDRLQRSLAGQRQLGGGTLKAEHAAVAELLHTVPKRVPPERRAAVEAALTRRQTMALQAILDDMDK